MRITHDALEELGSEELYKAVKNAEKEKKEDNKKRRLELRNFYVFIIFLYFCPFLFTKNTVIEFRVMRYDVFIQSFQAYTHR